MSVILSYLIAFQIAGFISIGIICLLYFIMIKLCRKSYMKKSFLLSFILISELATQLLIIPFSIYWFQHVDVTYWKWLAISIPALSLLSCILKYRFLMRTTFQNHTSIFHEPVSDHIYKP